MRKPAIKLTRLPIWRGCYGIAAAFIGSAPLLNTTAFSQPPVSNNTAQTRRHDNSHEGTSTREAREAAIQRIPFQQLTPEASTRLRSVIENASYFRRMPSELVDCDPEMFTFLVRHPEVIVNIWDVMDVTKVSLQRVGPYQLQGHDGAGTASKMDLVYGNESMHIYFASGSYRGNLWARELNGKCVVVLHNRPGQLSGGKQGILASMDVFMKLDNIGADLVVKTLGPLVGKTADYNFTECASFFAQISQTAEQNPYGIQQLAKRLTNIDPKTRDQFVATSTSLAQRSGNLAGKQVAAPPATAALSNGGGSDSVPILSLMPISPHSSTSSRRQPDSSEKLIEERIDSPTILLIGKEEQNRSNKP